MAPVHDVAWWIWRETIWRERPEGERDTMERETRRRERPEGERDSRERDT